MTPPSVAPSPFPLRSLSRAEVRDVDRIAIEEFGLPGIVLMENAGRGAAETLLALGPPRRVVVCCGKGNNGGDGCVIARHLENRGADVRALLFCDPDALTGDAQTNARVLCAAGTSLRTLTGAEAFDPAELDREFDGADWIVDALLGTGTRGTLREPFPTIVESVNRAKSHGTRVLAVDLPSGLDCDLGRPLGACVTADVTATFVARKLGFDVEGADRWTGDVRVIDIGVPRALLERFARDDAPAS